MVSTDNPRDRWLHEEMRLLFANVARRESPLGTVYLGRRDRPLKRLRNFDCEFVFRDRDRLLRAVSRPGVFSHRKVDPGARQLMAAMEIAAGDRVLELGCGSGTVSLAAACRATGGSVVAVDSHARAVECTALGAGRNALDNIVVEHSATVLEVALVPSTWWWPIRRTMRGCGLPDSFWKLATRHFARAAGSTSSANSPSGTRRTCRDGSTTLRSSLLRGTGWLAAALVAPASARIPAKAGTTNASYALARA